MEGNGSPPSLVGSHNLCSSSPQSKNSNVDTPLTTDSFPTTNTYACPATSVPRHSADPFGYMNSSPVPYSVGEPPHSLLLSDVPIRNPLVHNYTLDGLQSHPLINSSQFALHTQVEPIHSHAFVTFGAGMRQKEIDTFTDKHKLEARYTSGHGDGIPYHVPL